MMAFTRDSRWLAVLVVSIVVVSLTSSSALAFRMIQSFSTGRLTSGSFVPCDDPDGFLHWTTSTSTWYLNTSLKGSGKTSAIQASLAAWTNVSEAGYVMVYGGTTTDGWATDGRNTLLWAHGNGCTGSCLALTALVVQSGQVIVESDITFNNSYTWTTNGSQYDTQSVATHELGHALGVHHTEVGSTPRPTMYAYYFGSGGRSLESDDRSALSCSWCRYHVAEPCDDPNRCNLRPIARLTWSNPYGLKVDLDASASYDRDGTIVSYRWDFGDDSGTTTSSPTVSHWYSDPINYFATVEVIDDCGGVGWEFVDVTLCDPPDDECEW